ncbi:nucleoporin Nup35 [Drosophila obscura]|uniref:nucleoporin Nup35 n=1 Tax=Drosophila obscura TaxID=7282 RepID=UPI000BA075E9|nr:nucleoporin Nup35 [Drosophila obscura]
MEPMTLGSPVNSPNSNQGQYLPPFLMGDPQAMTPHKNTLSPKPGRYNVSFATSPTGSASHDFNRSGINTFFGPGGGSGGPHGSGGQGSNSAVSMSAVSSHNHQTGPPTQGLFESLREQSPYTPQRHHLSLLNQSQNLSLNQSQIPYQKSYSNESFVQITQNNINASMRGLYSPLGAPMSPLGGGGQCGGVDGVSSPRSGDFWVTIFGYVPGSSSMVLQHFTLCGTIVEVSHAPKNGNWMHVRFSSRIESDKALNFNQKVIGGNVMVGVTSCTEKSIVDKENCNASLSTSSLNAGEQMQSPKSPRIRPFVQQSYKLAQNDAKVVPAKDVPTKSSGLVDKAMDLLFGW